MPRHARNSTAGSVYTYHEKLKDSYQSGYGTKAVRLGKDSIQEFDCCCLTLQPCIDPVITPDGYLYDREAILKNILHQKKDIAKKLKEFEKQKERHEKEIQDDDKEKKIALLKTFMDKQTSSVKKTDQCDSGSVSNMVQGKDNQLPSFWIPSLTPQSKPTQIKKPDEVVRCPMSGKPLKYKDLISVKFTQIKDGDNRSLIAKEARFVCPVTNDILGNSVPCALLRTSGNVVTMECIEKIIKKDMIDPTNGQKLREKDIIQLQRGGTGFSSTGTNLTAAREGAVMSA